MKYDAFAGSPEGAGRSRSRSPAAAGAGNRAGKTAEERQRERIEVLRALAENGFDHVQVQGSAHLVASVQEADVRAFFDGFVVDKVCRGLFHRLSFVLLSFFVFTLALSFHHGYIPPLPIFLPLPFFFTCSCHY